MTIKNATVPPKVYYGLHFYPGVAEYREAGSEPYRIFINEKTIRDMGPTFQGKPVYVHHVDEVDLKDIHNADGFVVESFYNEADGKHWCKFLVVSDKGHQAISNGWKLSNAYLPKNFAQGGLWNGVEYQKEVTAGEYEHLAIVNDPRYQESIILSPEQFAVYNLEQAEILKSLRNSKTGEKPMLSIFKKQKVENAKDFSEMSVVLPKSKKEMTLEAVVNEMDSHYVAEIGKDPKAPAMANGDHHVKVGEEEMKVNDLVSKYQAACNEIAELKKPKNDDGDLDDSDMDTLDNADDDEEAKKKALELAEHEEEEILEKKKADKDKKENEDDGEKKAKKEEKQAFFNSLKNAEKDALAAAAKKNSMPKTDFNKLQRGQDRYGSGK